MVCVLYLLVNWPCCSPCTCNSTRDSPGEQEATVSDTDRSTSDRRHSVYRKKIYYRQWWV